MSWQTAKEEADRLAGQHALPDNLRERHFLQDDIAALVPEDRYPPAFRAMVIRAMKRVIARRGGRID